MYKMSIKFTYEWKQWMIKECQKLKKMHHLNQDPALKAKADNASKSRPFYVGGLDLTPVESEVICGYVIYKFEGRNSKPRLVYCDSARQKVSVPYKAGFLGFRESGPMVNTVRKQLKTRPEVKPDVILVDGNGILHPSRFGSACHVGVHLDIPTIGVAKKLHFFGTLIDKLQDDYQYIKETKLVNRFDAFIVRESDQPLGFMMLSKVSEGPQARVEDPIFVSQGYGISPSTSLMIVKWCLEKNTARRLPEPIFAADLCSRRRAAEIKVATEIESEEKKWRKNLKYNTELEPEEKEFWGRSLKYNVRYHNIAKFYNEIGLVTKVAKVRRSPSICSSNGSSGASEVDELVIKVKSMQFNRRHNGKSK